MRSLKEVMEANSLKKYGVKGKGSLIDILSTVLVHLEVVSDIWNKLFYKETIWTKVDGNSMSTGTEWSMGTPDNTISPSYSGKVRNTYTISPSSEKKQIKAWRVPYGTLAKDARKVR